MFKSLRNSFIRMNMLVISLIVLTSFTVVYILIYSNTRQAVQEELNILLNMPGIPEWRNPLERQSLEGEDEFDVPDSIEERPFANVPRMGFVVRSQNGEYEITQSRLFFVPNEFNIPTMLTHAASKSGNFQLNEHVWAYRTVTEEDGAVRTAFVEISESKDILANLIRIFVLITVLLMGAIWFVSRWFAKRSVALIEAAYNNQRRFIQDASHDLKTPVAVIKTNLELLRAYPNDTEDAKDEWLGNIHTETLRMERMTAQLLSMARAESEKPVRREFFSLTETVRSCVLPMEAMLFEKKLGFESSVEDGVYIEGYPDDIERLVHILIENASNYTPGKGLIKLSLRTEKRKAILVVTNTGDGIPEDELAHVFERFYRGDSARNRAQESYGLGLAIAQSIVQRHKGAISAQSLVGVETIFTVKLPL